MGPNEPSFNFPHLKAFLQYSYAKDEPLVHRHQEQTQMIMSNAKSFLCFDEKTVEYKNHFLLGESIKQFQFLKATTSYQDINSTLDQS